MSLTTIPVGVSMVVAAEIHTASNFCARNIVISTATRSLAATFASTLHQFHRSCRGWGIQTCWCFAVR